MNVWLIPPFVLLLLLLLSAVVEYPDGAVWLYEALRVSWKGSCAAITRAWAGLLIILSTGWDYLPDPIQWLTPVTLVLALVILAAILTVRYFWRELISVYLYKMNQTVSVPTTNILRSLLHSLPLNFVESKRAHTHPVAAGLRSMARNFMITMTAQAGKRPYMYQSSKKDEYEGLDRSRVFYTAKDLIYKTQLAKPKACHARVVVDVDYYIDMDKFVCSHDSPVLLYTAAPTDAAGTTDNVSWWFERNEYIQSVTGGAVHRHELWSYANDNMTFREGMFGVSWLPTTTLVTCYVERRRIAHGRDVVLIAPFARYTGLLTCLIARIFLSHNYLARLAPHVIDTKGDSWSFMKINAQKPYYSVSRQPTMASVRINPLVYAGLTSKNKVAAPATKIAVNMSHVRSLDPKMSMAAATIVADFFQNCSVSAPALVQEVPPMPKTYHPDVPDVDLDAPPLMHRYADPIADLAFVPADTIATERDAVQTRVLDVKTVVDRDQQLLRYAMELADLIANDEDVTFTTVVPCDQEEVWERQNRPAQRAILGWAAWLQICWETCVSVFLKRESYEDVNNARIISTIPGPEKLEYSRWMYSLAEVFKRCRWYGFGKVPRAIAEVVASLCAAAQVVITTDFSRMDGRITDLANEIVLIICARFIPASLLAEFLELARNQHHRRARGRHGTKYDTGPSRLSGSPETSLFNTLLNLFIIYVAFRSSGVSPRDAYQACRTRCIVGGDDGLVGDMPPSAFEHAAKRVGQKATYVRFSRGTSGVNFLGRVYGPYVWGGDSTSMCQLARIVGKLHLCVGIPPDPLVKWREKILALALTDANTPVIKSLITKTFGVDYAAVEGVQDSDSWWASFDMIDQWPNDFDGWMEAQAELELPTFAWEPFHEWASSDSSDLLAHRAFAEPGHPSNPKLAVTIDGEIVVAPLKKRVRGKRGGKRNAAGKDQPAGAGVKKTTPPKEGGSASKAAPAEKPSRKPAGNTQGGRPAGAQRKRERKPAATRVARSNSNASGGVPDREA